jgi:hypothetical protein
MSMYDQDTESISMYGQDPGRNRRLECQIIGVIAVSLAVSGILVIVLSVPWEIRFPIVAAASLFGPAIPALRIFSGRTLMECLVYGIGADIALLMLVSLGLVMIRAWFPSVAVIILLLTSLAAGARLILIGATT